MRILGFEITREKREMGGALDQLMRQGIRPRSLIDVGVGYGTPELYKRFPDARVLLIDPIEPAIRSVAAKLAKSRSVEYVIGAAIERKGFVEFHERKYLEGSTIYDEAGIVNEAGSKVRALTIDSEVAEKKLEPPYLLKLDIQGAELLALKGAERTIADCEAIISETSALRSLQGAPEIFELLSFMKQRGFVTYDIFGISYRPHDKALTNFDLVFVKEDSRIRQNKRFS